MPSSRASMILLGSALLLAVAAASAIADEPGGPAGPRMAMAKNPDRPGIDRFLRIRAPGEATVAPDGVLYVRDWPDGVYQLYRVDGGVATPDAPAVRLTDFPDGLSSYSVSPDGEKILLLHARGGNENTQVSLLDPHANGGKGRIVPLLSNPSVRFTPTVWLHDSRGFLYSANDESPNDFHVYRYDFAPDPFAGAPDDEDGGAGAERPGPGRSTKLLAKPGFWRAADITHDGKRVLVAQFRSASDSSMHELATETGELTDLTPRGPSATVAVEPVGYLPDETAVLYVCDVDEGISRLFMRRLATGEVTRPVPTLDPFEIDVARINPERTLLAVVTNEDGYGVPHFLRLPDFHPTATPGLAPGVVTISSMSGSRVVCTLSSFNVPGVCFLVDVAESTGENGALPARQITFADDQGIDLDAFPPPQLVRYSGSDGLSIPAFLYLPPGRQEGTPVPFVVRYHGGPESQSRPAFNALVQYLLSEGFGVMMPNVRGSAGYGRAYLMMDDYRKRWDSVRDGVDAAAWLVRNGYAEPGRIATWGGSYGGYMSMACLVEDQRRVQAGEAEQPLFGAGVNLVGVVNLKTFLEKTAGYRRTLREAEYGPLTDPEFLASVSPMTHVELIQVPVFIAHGFNDPRVPVEEAMQLAVALKDRGRSPQVFIAPDEGHGFAKLDNRLYYGERMAAFLREHIGR